MMNLGNSCRAKFRLVCYSGSYAYWFLWMFLIATVIWVVTLIRDCRVNIWQMIMLSVFQKVSIRFSFKYCNNEKFWEYTHLKSLLFIIFFKKLVQNWIDSNGMGGEIMCTFFDAKGWALFKMYIRSNKKTWSSITNEMKCENSALF